MTGGPGRPPVERGRRVLFGRPPGGAARRFLRDRRAVGDLPHGAAADGGLSRRDPRRKRAQPALPRHDHDPHGGGEERRRAGDRARGDQGARPRGGEGAALGRRRPRPPRPHCRRPADRPREEGPPGDPCGERALRRAPPRTRSTRSWRRSKPLARRFKGAGGVRAGARLARRKFSFATAAGAGFTGPSR